MADEDKPKVSYTYDERAAIVVIRRAMLRKPEIIAEIMKGGSYLMAERVLLQAKTEVSQLLEVNRAFAAAASVLAKQHKESRDELGRQAVGT